MPRTWTVTCAALELQNETNKISGPPSSKLPTAYPDPATVASHELSGHRDTCGQAYQDLFS